MAEYLVKGNPTKTFVPPSIHSYKKLGFVACSSQAHNRVLLIDLFTVFSFFFLWDSFNFRNVFCLHPTA